MGQRSVVSGHQPVLFEYGIQNEQSHLRAHVCPKVRRVYVFPTECGVAALKKGTGKHGYQSGVEKATAYGFTVKPFDIPRCVALQINEAVWGYFEFSNDDTTTEKGRKAAELIKEMITRGLFPLPITFSSNDGVSKRIDIQGTDILVWSVKGCIKIQVKCDFFGGEKELGGTGNLYLQTAERNPLHKH